MFVITRHQGTAVTYILCMNQLIGSGNHVWQTVKVCRLEYSKLQCLPSCRVIVCGLMLLVCRQCARAAGGGLFFRINLMRDFKHFRQANLLGLLVVNRFYTSCLVMSAPRVIKGGVHLMLKSYGPGAAVRVCLSMPIG